VIRINWKQAYASKNCLIEAKNDASGSCSLVDSGRKRPWALPLWQAVAYWVCNASSIATLPLLLAVTILWTGAYPDIVMSMT